MGGQTSQNLVAQKGGTAFVGSSPKIPTTKLLIGAFYCTWPVVHNTNRQDLNNDAFALHSAPLALTATITMDRQRQLSPLSVWVDSGLWRWLDFYGDDHVLFSPLRT